MLVWNEGIDLSVEIYSVLKNCKDYGLKDQMQRAAVSVPSNIAEGFECGSNKEFIRFLYIAKASDAELKTQLIIANRVGIISDEIFEKLKEKVKSLLTQINKLIQYRKEKNS